MPDPTDPRAVADDPSGIVQQMPDGGDDALKPCPFCGGRARTEGGIGDVLVECQKCGVCTTYEDSDVIAIAAWNRRATEADLRAEVERLREALTKINVGNGWAALIARAALSPETDGGQDDR